MRKSNWPHASFKNRKTYMTFRKSLKKVLATIPPVESKGNKPFQMTMKHFLDSLIYYHLDIPDSEDIFSRYWNRIPSLAK